MRRAVIALVLAVCSAAGAACSATAGEQRLAVIGGAADTAHPEVVALANLAAGETCSGVVIAPRVILTASHCVRAVTPAQLMLSGDAPLPAVASITIYPGATGTDADLMGGVDLAALFLAADVTVAPAVLASAAPQLAADVTLVGYGRDLPTGGTSGTRRAVATPITTMCDRVFRAGVADATTCTGDSGGGAYQDGVLVGLVSYGFQGCPGPSWQTRIDLHRAWLETLLDGVADACPTCLAPDPTCVQNLDAGANQMTGSGCAIWVPGQRE